MARYCDPADLYDHGVPRGALPNPGRLIASVDTSADTLTLDEHGFETDLPVTFRAEAGGALPAPLVSGTTYYAQPEGDYAFRVSAAAGGIALDLTTAGSRILVIVALPKEAAIDWASRVIDDLLPAHVVPIDTSAIPEIVRMTTAELAAGKLLRLTGQTSATLTAIVDAADKRLARWAKGVPLRGANVPPPAGLAQTASAPFRDSRGWRRFGGM